MAERLLRRARAMHMFSRLITALAGSTRGLSTLFATDPYWVMRRYSNTDAIITFAPFAHHFDALRHKAELEGLAGSGATSGAVIIAAPGPLAQNGVWAGCL